MDMNRAFFLKKEARDPKWRVIDAEGKVLGRLATEVADALRGKDRPTFTAHTDGGDYVVIINAEKIKLTGKKMSDKEYVRYSGWIGGQKKITAENLMQKHPDKMIKFAVKGMLPKNKLADQIIKKLKVYTGSEHPHKAQVSK
jgi:large subunit ribosomal protein L13